MQRSLTQLVRKERHPNRTYIPDPVEDSFHCALLARNHRQRCTLAFNVGIGLTDRPTPRPVAPRPPRKLRSHTESGITRVGTVRTTHM